MSTFDPVNDWLLSLHRAIEGYIKNNSDGDIYEVVLGFPSAGDLGRLMPLNKTVIHFEIDNVINNIFGFGRNIVEVDLDNTNKTVTEYEAQCYDVNFDVGIWASTRSGGVTARLVTYELISNLFAGASAYQAGSDLGWEVRSFNGGSFIREDIDDLEIFRVMNITLVLRVYRKKKMESVTFIGDFTQDQELTDPDGNHIS